MKLDELLPKLISVVMDHANFKMDDGVLISTLTITIYNKPKLIKALKKLFEELET